MDYIVSYMNKSHGVPALERGLDVLELLSKEPYELTAKEIAVALKIPNASLWRILRVLEARGYLLFDSSRRTYRLGFRLMAMGNFLLENSYFRSLIRDEMRTLAEVVKETVELDMRVKDQLILIEQVIGPEGLYLYSHPGSAMPYFHATAPGKVYLAHWEKERVRKVLGKLGLPKLTSKTIDSMERLEEELESVRQKGYAVDIEEMREGVGRIAAPVYDKGGKILGCIAVVAPAFRLYQEGTIERYASHLTEFTKKMSFRYERLG